ncbi:MAG: plasmid maintenance system antidote protein [Cyclobacteriaceae bacterium]|nr:plasmid maintenance system antidote protein [Cyclobacteriaceae bacterium]
MNQELEILKGIHPGIVLDRKISERNLSKDRFALLINEYPQTLGAITNGKRSMNTSLAIKIEKELDLEDGFFMSLQGFYESKQEKRKLTEMEHPDFSKLRRGLFWDTDMNKIDWLQQKRAVIQRVFERGNSTEKEEITRFYGDSEIKTFTEKPDHMHA